MSLCLLCGCCALHIPTTFAWSVCAFQCDSMRSLLIHLAQILLYDGAMIKLSIQTNKHTNDEVNTIHWRPSIRTTLTHIAYMCSSYGRNVLRWVVDEPWGERPKNETTIPSTVHAERTKEQTTMMSIEGTSAHTYTQTHSLARTAIHTCTRASRHTLTYTLTVNTVHCCVHILAYHSHHHTTHPTMNFLKMLRLA